MKQIKSLIGLLFILLLFSCNLSIYTPYVTVKKDAQVSKSFAVNNLKERYTIVAISAKNSFKVNTSIEPIAEDENFKLYALSNAGVYNFRVVENTNEVMNDLLVYCPAEKLESKEQIKKLESLVKGFFSSPKDAQKAINDLLRDVKDLDSFVDVLVLNKMLYDLDKEMFVDNFNAFNPELNLSEATNILNKATQFMEANQYNFTKLYRKEEVNREKPWEIIKIYNANIYKLLAEKMKELTFEELYEFSQNNKLSIEFILQNPYVKFRKKFIKKIAEDKIEGIKLFLDQAKNNELMIDSFLKKSGYTYEIIIKKILNDWQEVKPTPEIRKKLKKIKEETYKNILEEERYKKLYTVIDNFSQKKWHIKVREQISFDDLQWLTNLEVVNTLETKPAQKEKFFPIFDEAFKNYITENSTNLDKPKLDSLMYVLKLVDVDKNLQKKGITNFKKTFVNEYSQLLKIEELYNLSLSLVIPDSFGKLDEQIRNTDDYFKTLGIVLDKISRPDPELLVLGESVYFKNITEDLKTKVNTKFDSWETKMIIPLTVYLNKQKKVNDLDVIYKKYLKLGNASPFSKELN